MNIQSATPRNPLIPVILPALLRFQNIVDPTSKDVSTRQKDHANPIESWYGNRNHGKAISRTPSARYPVAKTKTKQVSFFRGKSLGDLNVAIHPHTKNEIAIEAHTMATNSSQVFIA
jgi:hypothetical protein